MDDETPSPERRIHDAADTLLLETGSLDAVLLAAVVGRVGGRRQNVARVFNRWRQDREMMAARLPEPVLRVARNAVRDLWLIVNLTAKPALPARLKMPSPSPAEIQRPPPSRDGAVSRRHGARLQTSAQAKTKRPPSPSAEPPQRPRVPTGRYSSLPPGPTAKPRVPTTFAEGHAARRAAKKAASAALRMRSADDPPKPRVRKPAPSRKVGRAPETPAQKKARVARMRAFVRQERPIPPPRPAVEADWEGAANPEIARAVATELRTHGRPMSGQVLVDTGRINLATNRAYRHLPPALAGSRIAPGPGGYWFDYEERPTGRKPSPGGEKDYQITRIVGELLWGKALALMNSAKRPPNHEEIDAHLQPEISDLNPEWLAQQIKRAKKDRLIKVREGGFILTKALHLYD